ncbi:MAG: hypothetical protein ACI4Q6_07935 [Huintestinicola sp.]
MKRKLILLLIAPAGAAAALCGALLISPVWKAGGYIIMITGAFVFTFCGMRLFKKDKSAEENIPDENDPDPEMQLKRINILYHSGRMDVREYNEKKMQLLEKTKGGNSR